MRNVILLLGALVCGGCALHGQRPGAYPEPGLRVKVPPVMVAPVAADTSILTAGTPARLMLRSGRQIEGAMTPGGADSVAVTGADGTRVAYAVADVHALSVRTPRSTLVRHAVIGAVVGGLLGALVRDCARGTDDACDRLRPAVRGGLAGAVVGAGVGVTIGVTRTAPWQRVPPPWRVVAG